MREELVAEALALARALNLRRAGLIVCVSLSSRGMFPGGIERGSMGPGGAQRGEAAHEAGDVDELDGGVDDLLGVGGLSGGRKAEP